MKKFFIPVTVILLLVASPLITTNLALADEPTPADSNYETLSQEAQRNLELLEIWKDHVKTLTKERDAAYKEIEKLKAAPPVPMANTGSVAQFGGVETQPIPSPEAAGQIQNLQSEVTQLRAQLEEKTQIPAGNASNRELQMQFSSLQAQLQQVKKDLAQAKSDKDRLIQEKEKALSQVERLNAKQETGSAEGSSQSADQIRSLQAEMQGLRAENENMRSQLNSAGTGQASSPENGDEARQAHALKLENDTLKAKLEKFQVMEKELKSTRAYFTPLLEDLQTKNDRLTQENASMKSELVQVRAETDGSAGQAEQYFNQIQKLNSQVQAMKSDQTEAANQVTALQQQVQYVESERDKYKGLDEAYQRLSVEHKAVQKAYMDLENSYKKQQANYREYSAQVAAIERENKALKAKVAELQSKIATEPKDGGPQTKGREQELAKQVEAYRTKLRANLTDMKNLKSNFEAYLDSLVTSFDEREKQ